MSNVSDEAVEAAAIAIQDRDGIHWLGGDKWETASYDQQMHARNLARAALTAAAPHIRAQVAAETLAKIAALDAELKAFGEGPFPGGTRHVLNHLAAHLAEGTEA